MSTAISTHSTKDCRFRDHWRPGVVLDVVLDVVVPMRKNDFSTFLLYIKPRTRVPLIRILQYRNSDPNFPSIP